MRNNGKPRHEAEIDLDDAIATFAYYAELAEQLPSKNRDVPLAHRLHRPHPPGAGGRGRPDRAVELPAGDQRLEARPGPAAGCTVVLKPSEVTPLIEQAYGQIADALGLPAGVLNIVNGKAETGAALSGHNGLDKLSFTGSNGVGSQVMRSAAAQCRPVTLELGGKSAIVVFDDCDVDQAVEWIVAGITWNAGQMCSATSRLLVQDGIADALLPRLQAALENCGWATR
jgi:betaine-aldehyde dehydrogenase